MDERITRLKTPEDCEQFAIKVCAWRVDLPGGCSENDIFVHMKYYAMSVTGSSGSRTFRTTSCPRTRIRLFIATAGCRRRTRKSHQTMEMTGRSEKRDDF